MIKFASTIIGLGRKNFFEKRNSFVKINGLRRMRHRNSGYTINPSINVKMKKFSGLCRHCENVLAMNDWHGICLDCA